MGKKNQTQAEKNLKKSKRKERHKIALGLAMNKNSNMKTQNVSAPSLNKHKQSIINDLKKKQMTSSRTTLIQSLNNKLEANNVSSYHNLYQMAQDSSSNTILYDQSKDQYIDNHIIEQEESRKLNETNKDNSKRAYMKILESVIESADVILEVLDARDPLSCRSRELESMILNHQTQKRIVLVLNKIDLIPVDNALMWQTYLSREYPAVLFKANTQNQNSNLSQSTLFEKSIKEKKEYLQIVLQSNKAIGGEELLNILKNYCRQEDIKTKIVVGVVGYPNVGKSSLINSLKRGKVVGVSSTPGYTKGLQEIILDGNITLLDCPGVVFSNSSENILQNVIRTEDITEPSEVVMKILSKMSIEYMINVYQLDCSMLKGAEINNERLLYLIGEKTKKYKKGGCIDLDKAARLVINDWNEGKLKYFSVPPGVDKEAYVAQLKKEDDDQMKY